MNHLKNLTTLRFQPSWQDLRRDEFWRWIPSWSNTSSETFHDPAWQERNAVTTVSKLRSYVECLTTPTIFEEITEALKYAFMALRVSPYIVALIDWRNPFDDPLRKQFFPLRSDVEDDHPLLRLDSLNEQLNSPVPGLVHRYKTKALFLPIDSCPVYCRFCTRSYSVGLDTNMVQKLNLNVDRSRWQAAFSYIAAQPELEDIVISGGDAFRLKPEQLLLIGETLLEMSNVKRIRFATKGLSVQPMKIVSDVHWVEALSSLVRLGRRLRKEVCLHTHFNHPNEITGITEDAAAILFERGINVRNQTVLLRGVNDDASTLVELGRRLGCLNVYPYYVFLSDLVPGNEDLRTTLDVAIQIEKDVRGSTSGFHTPTFVVDTLGGGGKRSVHSFEHYDRDVGVAVFAASARDESKRYFISVDPLRDLSSDARALWNDPAARGRFLDELLANLE